MCAVHRKVVFILSLLAFGLLAQASRAAPYTQGEFEVYGDFRTRLEVDFDSQRSNGTERDDRTRLRIRARLGLTYGRGPFSFGVRLRSGSDGSHQSPHITVLDLDGNDTDDADFNLDRWYARAEGAKAWAWIGRNNLPLWKQNDLYLDDDVTPAGVAFGWKTDLGAGGSFALNAGYFSPPVGMRQFAGNLGVGQLVLQNGGFTVAGALLAFDANPDDADSSILLRGNGARDYTIWVGSLQHKFKAGKKPFALGVDLLHNSENYSATDPDPFTSASHDQTNGFVLTTRLGSTGEKGDWLAAWYYAEIETFAVNSSYSEDDWARWGNANQNRLSDFKGHEFRFAYTLAKNQNLVFRFYRVEALTSGEDGSRFRVDFNYKF